MPTAVMAKVAKDALAGATTLGTPEVMIAKTRGPAVAAYEVLMFSLAPVDLAEMFARTVRLAALMRPTASMASDQAP